MFNSHTLRLPGLFQSPANIASQRDRVASQRSNGTLGPLFSTPHKSFDVEDGELSDTAPSGRQNWPPVVGALDSINNFQTSRDATNTTDHAQSVTARQSEQASFTTSIAAKQGFTDVYLAEQNVIAKKFVLAWIRSGKTYDQLVAEGLNAQILTGIFNELGISLKSGVSQAQPIAQKHHSSQISSSSAAQAKNPKKNGAAPKPVTSTSLGSSDTSSIPQSARSTMPNGSHTLPKKPPPSSVATGDKRIASPAAPNPVIPEKEPNSIPDRQEYIAKLMAAKNKKSELPKTAGPSNTTNAVSFGSSLSVVGTESSQPKSSSAVDLAEAKKRLQTAFVKKKMEELAQKKATKAAEAAAAASSAASHQKPALLDRPQYDGINENSASSTDKASVTRAFAPQATTHSSNVDTTSMIAGVATPIIASEARSTARNPSIGGRIPGLFMTAPPPVHNPVQDVSTVESAAYKDSAVMPTPTRKRPVAADFMDETWQATKRPSRQIRGNPEKPVVIEVSDDDMELPINVNTQSEHGPVNSLPTKDLPVRQSTESQDERAIPSKRPLLAAPVPSSESLRRQMEIIAMKTKIAELELKKRTRQVSTRPATPSKSVVAPADIPKKPHLGDKISDIRTQIAEAPSPDAVVQQAGVPEDMPGPSIPDTIRMPSATDSQPPSGTTPSPVMSDAARTAPPDLSSATVASSAATTQHPNAESAISLPTAVLIEAPDLKSRRRAEIKSGLPALEASYAHNNSKLEALKAQMKELEEAIRQDQEDKQRLVDELESLGVDTEGMNHTELRETKDEIVAQAVADADAGFAMQTDDVKNSKPSPRESKISTAQISTEPDPLPRTLPQGLSTQNTAASMSISSAAGSMSESASDPNENDQAMYDTIASESEEGAGSRLEENSEEDHAVEASGSELETASQRPTGKSDEDEADVEQELLDDEAVIRAGGSEDVSMDEDSAGESGEISSSGSVSQVTDSNSYSPDIVDIEDGDNGHVKDADQAELLEAESDEVYEPPEPDQSHMRMVATYPATSDASSDAAEEDYEPPDALASRHSEEGEMAEDEEEYTPPEIQPVRSAQPASPAPASQSRSEGEISENEQSEVSEVADVADSEPMINAFHDLPSTERFQPYQSALRNFRAYRFHPEFASTVPGGWRSATYSFQGDPSKTWCPEELNGGKCDDAYCDHQHFRSMTVQDDELLRQLGVSNPGSDDAEKAEFLAGLRSMIMDLRQSDPTADALANAIISFRRKYMEERGKDTIFTS